MVLVVDGDGAALSLVLPVIFSYAYRIIERDELYKKKSRNFAVQRAGRYCGL